MDRHRGSAAGADQQDDERTGHRDGAGHALPRDGREVQPERQDRQDRQRRLDAELQDQRDLPGVGHQQHVDRQERDVDEDGQKAGVAQVAHAWRAGLALEGSLDAGREGKPSRVARPDLRDGLGEGVEVRKRSGPGRRTPVRGPAAAGQDGCRLREKGAHGRSGFPPRLRGPSREAPPRLTLV
jgi:hypothetical protein